MALDDIFIDAGKTFNPYIFLPKPPDFKPEHQYRFIPSLREQSNKKHLTFVKPCKGAHGLIHYLFKDRGGSLESFTQIQLMDYRLEEVADGH